MKSTIIFNKIIEQAENALKTQKRIDFYNPKYMWDVMDKFEGKYKIRPIVGLDEKIEGFSIFAKEVEKSERDLILS